MLQRAICRGLNSQTGWVSSGARLPRHVASVASARRLSTVNSHLIRPHALRTEFRVLPGTVRNFSLWPSKPVPPPVEPTPVAEAPPPPSFVEEPAVAAVPELPDVPVADIVTTPEVTNAVQDALSSMSAVETLAAIPAMHYGDLAALGLAGWSPAGFFRWGMEALHVSTGLPWFWTIVGMTIFSRVIVMPFAIQGIRNAAKLAPYQDKIQESSAQMREAFAKKDQFEQQRLQLKQMALYKEIGVNPASSMISPLVQLPVSLGMFFGVKKLCELPVEQLKWSGVSFLPDLTVPDPTWVLPVLTVLAINAQLSVSARDMVASSFAPHMINVFRVMTIASLYLFSTWPSGIQVNIIAGVLTLTLQSILLRIPALRRKLDLPIVPKGAGIKSVSLKETYDAIRKWISGRFEEGKARATLATPNKSVRPKTHKRRR